MAQDKAEIVAIILLGLTIALIGLGVTLKMENNKQERAWNNKVAQAVNDLAVSSNNLAMNAEHTTLEMENSDHDGQVKNAEQNERITALERGIAAMLLHQYKTEGRCIVVRNPNATSYEMQCQTT